MNEINTNAGTYTPHADNGAGPLVLQYEAISAVVYQDGSFAVFAGTAAIGKGQLDGTEGPLMPFFTETAKRWSELVDEVMAEEASERAGREAAHRAEAFTAMDRRSQGIPELITMVDSLGGRYRSVVGRALDGSRPSQEVDYHTVLEVLRNAAQYGFGMVLKDRVEGSWYLELNDDAGKVHGRYHYMGH